VVISTQHDEKVSNKDLHDAVMDHVDSAHRSCRDAGSQHEYHINPTGRFVIGGRWAMPV